MQTHCHPIPVFWNCEFSLIRTHRIVILRHKRRIYRSERINGTFVNRHAIAFHFPIGWHLDFVPAFYFVFVKILWSFLKIIDKLKIPFAIQHFHSAFFTFSFQCIGNISKRISRCSGWFTINTRNHWVFPRRKSIFLRDSWNSCRFTSHQLGLACANSKQTACYRK